MRTIKKSSNQETHSDVFHAFQSQKLTAVQMNYIRGGGDPPMADPPIDPIDVLIPLP